MSLIAELKRRNVIRVGAAYLVGMWLLIQVAETVLPFYGVSDTVIRWIITLLAIGLIPTLLIAWIYELTPDGLRKDSGLLSGGDTVRDSAKRLDRIIVATLAIALVYFAVDKFVLDPARDRQLVEETTREARSEALVESYGNRSIAVLPFVDMSVNGDQEYMSDGIAEELLNLLAKIPDLRVISRSSAFAFKGKDIDIPGLAQQLNASYVLEGSVRQAGDQLRITAQLIEARSDTHLWSETYDRKLENIFQIQDEISAAVVDQLKLTLLGDVPRAQVMDQEAFREVLQARYFWNRRAEGDVERALQHFEYALERSPDYAPAWAGVAWANSVVANEGAGLTDPVIREERLRLAEAAARKAVELDPELSDAYVRMGQAYGRAKNYSAAKASFAKALELDPDSPLALGVNALQVWKTGDLDGSIAMFEKIEDMDPLSAIWPANRFTILVRAGRYEEALAANERFFMLSGNQAGYDGNRAVTLELMGRYEDSWALTEGAPEFPDPLTGKAILLHYLDRHEEAEAFRQKLVEMNPPNAWFHLAKIYTSWGDHDRAFEQLSEENVAGVAIWNLQFDPHLAPLKTDPRWQDVLGNSMSPFNE